MSRKPAAQTRSATLAMSRSFFELPMQAKVMGVARVNGDLAVSRAFGDAQHKNTGGLHPFCKCLLEVSTNIA